MIFGAESSNSRHATNKIQSILLLGHGLVQKINNTTIYAEKLYSLNFSGENKAFCLSLHYNDDDSYLFVNGKEVTKLKAKDSEVKTNQLILGSISTSTNLSSGGIEDSKPYGNVYDFSVDYSAVTNDEIVDIHKYLMKKNNIVSILGFIKKCFLTAITFFSSNILNVNSLKCVSMNNQKGKIRAEIINVNTNEPMFCPYSIKMNK